MVWKSVIRKGKWFWSFFAAMSVTMRNALSKEKESHLDVRRWSIKNAGKLLFGQERSKKVCERYKSHA